MTQNQLIAALLDDAGIETDRIVATDSGNRTAFEVLEGAVLGALEQIEENS